MIRLKDFVDVDETNAFDLNRFKSEIKVSDESEKATWIRVRTEYSWKRRNTGRTSRGDGTTTLSVRWTVKNESSMITDRFRARFCRLVTVTEVDVPTGYAVQCKYRAR